MSSSAAPLAVNGLAGRLWAPIARGSLAGARWAIASRGKTLRILLGSYERDQTAEFVRRISAGDTLFDVGAHVGYYTLLGARLVGPQGRVLAFEPQPRNARFLERHIVLNRFTNVSPFECAIGAVDGEVRFASGQGSATGRIAPTGAICVAIHRLDTIVDREGAAPTHIKIDVEGAELDVLEGARETISHFRPVIFLSTHGTTIQNQCRRWLETNGYTIEAMVGDDIERSSELLCLPSSVSYRRLQGAKHRRLASAPQVASVSH